MKTLALVVLTTALLLSGCTSVQVSPINAGTDFQHVCIHENPRVKVSDFVSVIREGFARHGVSTETFSGGVPGHCKYVLTYTALRSWDFAPYLAHAELIIARDGRIVANATYHLVGGGGFSLYKWDDTKSKMAPVIDRLFQGNSQPVSRQPVSQTDEPEQMPVTRSVPTFPALAARPETGFYAYSASVLPEARVCAETPKAKLIEKGKGFELYSIACDNGDDVLSVRCEPGKCRVLR